MIEITSGGIIAYIIEKGGPVSVKLIKWLLRKNPRFAVVGYRETGKTCLLDRMQGLRVPSEYIPTVGAPPVPDFEWHGIGETHKIKKLKDYGGEVAFWQFWEDGIVRDRPLGIVFMLDHTRSHEHQEALRYLVDFLTKKDRRFFIFKGPHSKTLKALKVVMILVNKSDLWRPKKSIAEILRPLEIDIERLQAPGIQVLQYSCSVTEGTNVFEALTDFFSRMLGKH